jgi:hypothetical protein
LESQYDLYSSTFFMYEAELLIPFKKVCQAASDAAIIVGVDWCDNNNSIVLCCNLWSVQILVFKSNFNFKIQQKASKFNYNFKFLL